MKIKYPDYENCITNLSCSVLKYYGITPPNTTLTAADKLLSREYKNVVVLLLDGLGLNVILQNCDKDGFFRSHLNCGYSSVFPPTTVAATTSFESGLYPNQTGYLGWTIYIPQLRRNVVVFENKDVDTKEKLERGTIERALPIKSILDTINEAGIKARKIAPYEYPYPDNYKDFCEEIEKACGENGRQFIYAYYHEPDATMHEEGIDTEQTYYLIRHIEAETEKLAEALDDTLLIITADHGHINIKTTMITNHPDITECLIRTPTIEPRAVNMFVKEEYLDVFPEIFYKHYKDSFKLFTRKEILQMNLFGKEPDHPLFYKMIGDFIAVGVENVTIRSNHASQKGHHAGLTREEMTIPLIAKYCNKR